MYRGADLLVFDGGQGVEPRFSVAARSFGHAFRPHADRYTREPFHQGRPLPPALCGLSTQGV